MTIDEAKVSLKVLCHTCKHFPTCVNDKPECFQAIDMAIKSLEAWEKVKEEVEDKIGSLDDELKDGEVCLSYYYGKLAGLSEVLEIIDKHLAEVNE